MNREIISQALGNIDAGYIQEAAEYDSGEGAFKEKAAGKGTYRKKDFGKGVAEIKDSGKAASRKRGIPGIFAVSAAAGIVLCLVVSGIAFFSSSRKGRIIVYARETGEEITAAGAVLHAGSISDSGEMKGHPLMFYLSGEDIASVRFSCKREQISFMDWTEQREEYGNAQNFTVSYGEDEREYYYLTVDWIPNTLIRELTDSGDSTIAGLPEEMRSDIIVMEITFENGKTATKAITVSLLEDGTFFAALEDYRIGEADAFVRRPDSQAIPRDILYAQGDRAAEGAGEVTTGSSADAPEMIRVGGRLYKRSAGLEGSYTAKEEELVYLGKIASNVTDGGSSAGTEMGAAGEERDADGTGIWVENEVPEEDFQANHPIVGAEVYQYGEDIIVRVDGEYRLYELEVQGETRAVAQEEVQGENVWHGEDAVDGDSLMAAEAAAKDYYTGTVFGVVSLEVKEQTAEEIVFSVRVSKGGVIQEPDRSITLRREDGKWKVVNEGY